MKFSIEDFFIKYDQIHWKMQVWSHLLKKLLIMENVTFCAANGFNLLRTGILLFMTKFEH